MKKNYLFVCLCLFGLGAVQAQERTTLAFWDFEGTSEDTYAYFVDDEENGTTRAWVKPNEGTAGNLSTAKISSYREGVDGDGTAISYYSSLTSTTTTNFGGRCLNANEWGNDPIQSLRCWYLEDVSTLGMKQVEIELYMASVGTKGMTQFRFDYKIGDGEWVLGIFKDVRTGCSTTSKVGSDAADYSKIELPGSCDNQAKVSCRWVSNDTNPAGDSMAKKDGASRMDNLKVSAVADGGTGIADITAQSIIVDGNRVVAKESTQVAIYTIQGVSILNKVMKSGESFVLSEGLYIIETQSGKMKAMIR